jgi:hypothetical protein
MTKDGLQSEEVTVDPNLPESVQNKVVDAEIGNANKGRSTGLLIILIGVLLTLAGVSGVVDLDLSGLGLSAKVAKAAPGIVLILVGLFVIWITSLRIKAPKPK